MPGRNVSGMDRMLGYANHRDCSTRVDVFNQICSLSLFVAAREFMQFSSSSNPWFERCSMESAVPPAEGECAQRHHAPRHGQ